MMNAKISSEHDNMPKDNINIMSYNHQIIKKLCV